MMSRISFAPLLPPLLLAIIALLALLVTLFYWRRGGPARLLRMGANIILLLAIFNPSIVTEVRAALPDVATILIDRSDSMRLGDRTEKAEKIARDLAARLKNDPTLEVHVRDVAQTENGTEMFGAIAEAISDTPRERLAGTILVTDGQVRDVPKDPKSLKDMGPISAAIVGDSKARDRRLRLISSPRFIIADEASALEVQVDDSEGNGRQANIVVRVDGGEAREYSVTTGEKQRIPFVLAQPGSHLIEVSTPLQPGELTALNNRVFAQVSAMRDRLRVLLITGEPHAGARVWRDFLKSDPSVDQVQFAILRPPGKEDGTATEELALIPFPVDSLFQDKLTSFDLVIFDRYKDLGILPEYYFSNVADYVRGGGALLVVGGPPDVTDRSLYRTPLAGIFPARPGGSLNRAPFKPTPTDLGRRHPVLATLAPQSAQWGRWMNSVPATASGGQTLLQGPGGPLLVLGRVGQGRTAQLFSDQMWLWARGFEGGGPHGELLRRMAHWLMREPELEEERLTAKVEKGELTVERRTLSAQTPNAEISSPSGARTVLAMTQTSPGLFTGRAPAAEQGLYTARQDRFTALAASGPLNPTEWADVRATGDILKPAADATNGSVLNANNGTPETKRVARGDRAANALPLVANKAYAVASAKSVPLLPAWLAAAIILALLLMAWRREAK